MGKVNAPSDSSRSIVSELGQQAGAGLQVAGAEAISAFSTAQNWVGAGTPITRDEYDILARGYRADEDGGTVTYEEGMSREMVVAQIEVHRRLAAAERLKRDGYSDDVIQYVTKFAGSAAMDPINWASMGTTGALSLLARGTALATKSEWLVNGIKAYDNYRKAGTFTQRLAMAAPEVALGVAGSVAVQESQGKDVTAGDVAFEAGTGLLFTGAIIGGGLAIEKLKKPSATPDVPDKPTVLTPEEQAAVGPVLDYYETANPAEELLWADVYGRTGDTEAADAAVASAKTRVPDPIDDPKVQPSKETVQAELNTKQPPPVVEIKAVQQYAPEGIARFESSGDAAIMQTSSPDKALSNKAVRFVAQNVKGFNPRNPRHRSILQSFVDKQKAGFAERATAQGHLPWLPLDVPDSGLVKGFETELQNLMAVENAAKIRAQAKAQAAEAATAKPELPTPPPASAPAAAEPAAAPVGTEVSRIGDPLINPQEYDDKLLADPNLDPNTVRAEASISATAEAQKRIEEQTTKIAGGPLWGSAVPPNRAPVTPHPVGSAPTVPADPLANVEFTGGKRIAAATAAIGKPNVAVAGPLADPAVLPQGKMAAINDPSLRETAPGLPPLQALQDSARATAFQRFLEAAGETNDSAIKAIRNLFAHRDNSTYWNDVYRAMKGDPNVSPEAKHFADTWNKWYADVSGRLRNAGILIGQINNWTPQDMDISRVLSDELGFKQLIFDGLDRSKYGNLSDADTQKFADDLYKAVTAADLGTDETLKMLKQRELHLLPSFEKDFINAFGDGPLPDMLQRKIQSLESLAATAPYYGPDAQATVGKMIDTAAEQAKNEARFVFSEREKLVRNIAALEEAKAAPGDIKAAKKVLKEFDSKTKDVLKEDSVNKWHNDIKRVVAGAFGEYDKTTGSDPSLLEKTAILGSRAFTGTKTAGTVLLTAQDIGGALTASMPTKGYLGIMNPINWLDYMSIYMETLADTGIAQTFFGRSLNQQQKIWADQLGISLEAMSASFRTRSLVGEDDPTVSRRLKGAWDVGKKAVDLMTMPFQALNFVELLNHGARTAHNLSLQRDMARWLDESRGNMKDLMDSGYSGRAMATKLKEAGINEAEWRQLYEYGSDVLTDARVGVIGFKRAFIDPTKLDVVDRRLSLLHKNFTHYNFMEGIATSGIFEADLARRGMYISRVMDASQRHTARRVAANTMSMFLHTITRMSSAYRYQAYAGGSGHVNTYAPIIFRSGVAAAGVAGLAILKGEYTWDEIKSDPQAFYSNPQNLALVGELSGQWLLTSEMHTNLNRIRMRLDYSQMGVGARPMESMPAHVAEAYAGAINPPMARLGGSSLSLANELWRDKVYGNDFLGRPDSKEAAVRFAQDLLPANVGLGVVMGYATKDIITKMMDEGVFMEQQAQKQINLGFRKANLGYDILYSDVGMFMDNIAKSLGISDDAADRGN